MFPAGQAVPQAPQLSLSEGRWTQSPLQSVKPPWQSSTHWPFWQASPAGQALPQAPQLASSVCRSAQALPQVTVPGRSRPRPRRRGRTLDGDGRVVPRVAPREQEESDDEQERQRSESRVQMTGSEVGLALHARLLVRRAGARHFASKRMLNCTRRLAARPASVSFLAMGASGP